MAIFNIQEILHPSDSNQIKWEKVNYNFDQILANGGGPIGKKGNPGDQGSVGQTGQKGDQGEIGPQGLTGETTSRWKVIPVNNGTAQNEYVILKPKVSTDNYHPVIFLGDQDFNEVQDNNGRTNLRSTIVVGKHAVGGNSPSDELITYWHGQRTGTSNNIAITLSTSEQTDGDVDWTRFTLAETYGANLNTDPAEIIEYFVELDKFTFKSNVSFDSNINNTFKLPETNVAAAFLEAGMIRFRDGAFWGAIEDGNGTVSWKEFCTAPCGAGSTPGTVAIVEQPADLNLNQYGGIIGNTVVIDPSGDLEVDENGDPWTGEPATTLATAATTSATNATNAPVETIAFTGDESQFVNITHSGGAGEITYSTTPTVGLILSADKVTAPAWVTIDSYFDGTTFDPELNFTIAANATGARTGNIVITHPSNANATDSMTISQVANPEYGQGCTDPNADNYDPNATGDDGSCTYCANFAKDNETPVNPTTYGGSDGQFTMTATGGSANYELVTYLASNDQIVNTFALAAGTYYAIITDITNGCTDRHDFTLVNPATNATATPTPATQAPAPAYNTLTASPGDANVDEGTTIVYTVGTTDIVDGTTVWLNLTGSASPNDYTGDSSGAGAGVGNGLSITINNNTGSGSIDITNDVVLEAVAEGDREDVVATLLATDSAGNATGSLSVTRNITDTSWPAFATFAAAFSPSLACNSSGGTYTINYDGTQSDFLTKMIDNKPNIYVNNAKLTAATTSSSRTPDAGWGADKIGFVFDLNGTTDQDGVDCSGYITEATTVATTTAAPCTKYFHSWNNNTNSTVTASYTECGVPNQITSNPFTSTVVCADLISVNLIQGTWSNFQIGAQCYPSSGSGSGGDSSGSGSGDAR